MKWLNISTSNELVRVDTNQIVYVRAVAIAITTIVFIGLPVLIEQLPKTGIEPNYTIVEVNGKQYLKQEGLNLGNRIRYFMGIIDPKVSNPTK